MSAAVMFDTGLPKIIRADGCHIEVPAEVVAQADDEMPLLETCLRYARKIGAVPASFKPMQHAALA